MSNHPRKIAFSAILALTVFVASPAALAGKADAPGQNRGPTIVDIAVSIDSFSTLTAAVVCTGLVGALDGNRQFTVFAPTDAAFFNLGLDAGNVCDLLGNGLTDILLYHVAPGGRSSGPVLNSNRIRMLNGDFTYPSLEPAGAFINESRILVPDVNAVNGVIHVIDTVLLPPAS